MVQHGHFFLIFLLLTWTSTNAPQPSHLTVALPDDDGDDEEKAERKGTIYDKLDKTKDIAVENGYVTFMQSFWYLGSLISYNLCDNDNVTA
jgi:hypothetical protein